MQNLNQNIEDLDRFVSREAASKKRAARYRFEVTTNKRSTWSGFGVYG